MQKISENRLYLNLMGNLDLSLKNKVNVYLEKNSNYIKLKKNGYINDVLDHYYSSDIIILLSLEEGQVTTVLEAISCGCIPIISINCGIDLPDEYVIKNPRDNIEILSKFRNIINNINYYKENQINLISLINNNLVKNNPNNTLQSILNYEAFQNKKDRLLLG